MKSSKEIKEGGVFLKAPKKREGSQAETQRNPTATLNALSSSNKVYQVSKNKPKTLKDVSERTSSQQVSMNSNSYHK